MFARICLIVLFGTWLVAVATMPAGDVAVTAIVLFVVSLAFADEAGVNVTLPISLLMRSLSKASLLAFSAGFVGPLEAMRLLFANELAFIDRECEYPLLDIMSAYKQGKFSKPQLINRAYQSGRNYREEA